MDKMETAAMAKRPRDGEVRLHALNTKTTKAMRDKIEAAAAASGRSLTQEVEYRLEQSFWHDLNDRSDDRATLYLSNKIMRFVEGISRISGLNWEKNPAMRAAVRVGIEEVLDMLYRLTPLEEPNTDEYRASRKLLEDQARYLGRVLVAMDKDLSLAAKLAEGGFPLSESGEVRISGAPHGKPA